MVTVIFLVTDFSIAIFTLMYALSFVTTTPSGRYFDTSSVVSTSAVHPLTSTSVISRLVISFIIDASPPISTVSGTYVISDTRYPSAGSPVTST